MPACPACQFPEVPEGALTCPDCGALQRSAQTSIEVNIEVGAVEQGQVTGVVVERMGYSAEEVQALINQIHAGFTPRPFSGECPYRGLEPFEEEDAGLFFGREQLVADILQRLSSTRFLLIAGASGSGKSSLIRAGVLPALKQNELASSQSWLYLTIVPGRAPLDSLGGGLSSLAGSLTPLDDFHARGKQNPGLLSQWSEVLLGERRSRRLVLLVDQFEEIFTNLSEKEEEQRLAFIRQLTQAVNAQESRLILLLTMRTDFLSQCAAYPELNDLVNRSFLQVGALSPEELVSAIERPAMQVGLSIQPELVYQIVLDMRDQAGALPLMQFALKDLFEAQITQAQGRALTLDGYLARGGLAKALQRYADSAFARLSPAEQELARALFRGLVVPGRGAQDTRRTAFLHELVPSGADARQIESVVNKLADARLVTTGEPVGSGSGDMNAERTVTLAHERLLEVWPWLHRLVQEDRILIILKNEIEEDARRWDENRRDPSYLYSGARLDAVLEQINRAGLSLSSLALSFVQAATGRREALSLQEQAREKAERRRGWQLPLAAVLAMAVLVAAGWLGYRLWLRSQAIQLAPMVHFDPSAAALGEENSRVSYVAALLRLNLPAFDLDVHEVTNAQYCRCRRASACSSDPPYAEVPVCDPSIAQLPVTNVTLEQADQYCRWLGRRLPAEIEWEWAARGPENRIYPTGNTPPLPGQVNIWDQVSTDGAKWPVDRPSADITPDTLLGMAGNVREWTLSLWLPYDHPEYLRSYWPDQVAASEGYYVARGGSFMTGPDSARSISRYQVEPGEHSDDLGFRCLQGLPIQEFAQEVSAIP